MKRPRQTELKLEGGTAGPEPRSQLPAATLLSLAKKDLSERAGDRVRAGGAYRREVYAFHFRHVYLATDPADLLRRAINDFYSGHYCSKRDTRRHVYADLEELRRAYDLATGAE